MILITDKEFYILSQYVKDRFGINLTEKKRTLVNTRLQSELYNNNFSNFKEYIKYLKTDSTGEVMTNFINKITTNHNIIGCNEKWWKSLGELVFQFFKPMKYSQLSRSDTRLFTNKLFVYYKTKNMQSEIFINYSFFGGEFLSINPNNMMRLIITIDYYISLNFLG